MNMNIGNIIANLRKQKGLTQEQLANAVGVSTPAVSKWETNSSYPDITLLAPIARALRTNIDTLLSYTAKLTNEQAAALAAEVALLAADKGISTALERAKELLCNYPENTALQFHMATILIGMKSKDETERLSLREQAKTLLETVLDSGDANFFSSCAYLLADICITENELDKAERLLDSMPGPSPDGQLMKATVYEKRGEFKKAKLIVQTNLFVALQKAETCLAKLMAKNYAFDSTSALCICEIHKKLAELMDYPYAMSDGLFAEVYMRDGKADKAADSILSLAQSLQGEAKPWGKLLFSELSMNTELLNATLSHLRKMVLDNLQNDEDLVSLHENKTFKEAVILLQDHMK